MYEPSPKDNISTSRSKKSKFSDENEAPQKIQSCSSKSKASSWGSHLVKGLGGAGDKKTKPKRTPQAQAHTKLTSSQDLFVEIENLRSLLKESKHREFQLQSDFRKLLPQIDALNNKIKALETDKLCLKQQLLSSNAKSLRPKNVDMEVLQLRRLNKELQLHNRNLTTKLTSLQSQSESMGNIKAEASFLRRTNQDLSKQVEGLQMNRLNEVEELAYLRWVNSQLRNQLQSPCSCAAPDPPPARYNDITPIQMKCSTSIDKKHVTNEDLLSLEEINTGRRHSISGSNSSDEHVLVNRRRQSDGFMRPKQVESRTGDLEDDLLNYQHLQLNKVLPPPLPTENEKRALRIPNPPPRPSSANSNETKEASDGQTPVAPPPPPPPPPPLQRISAVSNVGVVQRAPQVVEFYHSLMKRDTRRDSTGGAISDSPNLSSVRSNMIGEIENRSSYLLAIKADVETQGEFVNSLIREVNNAIYKDIDDVVEFVKWLDDELCFLVDERAVLKHFDWPEKKADTMREAAFGYKDLKKLELEVAYYQDDPRLPCDLALRKMVSLSEKIERTIYSILRTRESLIRSCKEFQIPTNWMLDSGIISKVKLGSVKLAKKYMDRVATELQSRSSLEKDVAMDYMLLQGVRFAFRIHQFAGGFDAETMQAFEELRKLAHALDKR